MSGSDAAPDRLHMSLGNHLEQIAGVDAAVSRFLLDRRIDPTRTYLAQLVLEEVLSNVIRHGLLDSQEHTITVEVAIQNGHVVVHVTDDGLAFDPLTAPPFDVETALQARSGGGMGIHLVRSCARRLSYRRHAGRNHLEIML